MVKVMVVVTKYGGSYISLTTRLPPHQLIIHGCDVEKLELPPVTTENSSWADALKEIYLMTLRQGVVRNVNDSMSRSPLR